MTDARATVVRMNVIASGVAADAGRFVTAVRAQSLMGNPSTAEGRSTVVRLNVIRTADDPSAPRRVTNVRTSILRSVRRGDGGRPSVQGRAVFNDITLGGATGEYAIEGYVGVASPSTGFTGAAYMGSTFYNGGVGITMLDGYEPVVGPTRVPFAIGYGAGGDAAKLIRQWHEGLTQLDGDGNPRALYTVPFLVNTDLEDYPFPYRVVAEVDDTGDVNGYGPGGDGDYPVGLSLSWLTWSSFGSSPYPTTIGGSVAADYTPTFNWLLSTAPVPPYPDAAGPQWALPTYTVQQNLALTYGSEFSSGTGLHPYVFRQGINAPYDIGDIAGPVSQERTAPKLTVAKTMGRGAYRVVPTSYRDWTTLTDGKPPLRFPLQGSNDPMEEMYGVTYGSPEALWDALAAHADLSSMNLDWPARDNHSVVRYSDSYSWFAVMPHRWGPAFKAVGSPMEQVMVTSDDGEYVTSSGQLRYRRFKTLLMHQNLAYDQTEDLSGTPESASEYIRLTRYLAPTEYVAGAVYDFNATVLGADLYLIANGHTAEEAAFIAWILGDADRLAYYIDKSTNGGTAAEGEALVREFLTEFYPGLLSEVEAYWDTLGPGASDVKQRRIKINSLYWDADDIDPTIYNDSVMPPCFFVEKLDSPSTHFNDPPGTPGVDDF